MPVLSIRWYGEKNKAQSFLLYSFDPYIVLRCSNDKDNLRTTAPFQSAFVETCGENKMLIALFLFIWFINIIFGAAGKSSKALNIISFVFLLIVFAGNTLSHDYLGYLRYYDSGLFLDRFQFGFAYLGYLCHELGLSYNQFVLVLITPCYLLIFYLIKKFDSNASIFISLYFASLLFYDINQIRNFASTSFVTLAFYFLISKNSNKNRMLFAICILLASTFQSIALVYIFLVFFKLDKSPSIHVILVAAFVAVFGSIIIKLAGGRIDLIAGAISILSPNPEASDSYSTVGVGFGILIPILCLGCNAALVLLSARILESGGSADERNNRLINLNKYLLLLGLLVIPLCFVNLTFDRIIRNTNFLVYILAGVSISFWSKENRNTKGPEDKPRLIKRYSMDTFKSYYLLALVLYSLIWAVCTEFRYNGLSQLEAVLILSNNMFF